MRLILIQEFALN